MVKAIMTTVNVLHNIKLVFKIYKKADDFIFFLEVKFTFLKRKIHSNITYSAFYSKLFRYARISSNYIDFKNTSQ